MSHITRIDSDIRRRLVTIAGALCLLAWATSVPGEDGGTGPDPQDASKAVVSVTGTSKLSPEFVAAKLTGGKVIGRTQEGQFVVTSDRVGFSPEKLSLIAGITRVAGAPEKGRVDPIDNRVIVAYQPDQQLTEAAIEEAGLRLVDRSPEGAFVVVVGPGTTRESGITPETAHSLEQLLEANPSIRYVEPDYIVSIPQPADDDGAAGEDKGNGGEPAEEPAGDLSAATIPNDPGFSQLWGMKNIHAPEAWDTVRTSRATVAVIDTGVDYQHEDLGGNMWKNPGEIPNNGRDDDGNGIVDDVFGADFANNDGDPMDDQGHGTHCAGTIGAVGNNRKGVSGVDWKIQIMALKFLTSNGSGSTANAVKCIDYAIKKKARIMSNSWGGGGFSQTLADAITRAENAKILFVAAAGNSGTDNDVTPHYPSSYPNPNIIAVLSIDQNDVKSSFSCFGKKSVDIGAPGRGIYSTVPMNMGKYGTMSGTSMATPHVSGAAALVLGHPRYKTAPWNRVRDLLYKGARKLPDLKDKCVTEATLDITFLRRALLGEEELAGGGYSEFGKIQIVGNRTIASATIVLTEPSFVRITALATARLSSAGSATNVITGLTTQNSATVIYTNSLRRSQAAGAGAALPLTTSFGLRLGVGRHTVYWNVWPFGSALATDSGTLLVQVDGGRAADTSESEDASVTEVTDEGTIRRRVTTIETEDP